MENKKSYQMTEKITIRTMIRGCMIVVLLTCVFLNCIYGFGLPSNEIGCLEDVSHEYTANINLFLQNNKNVTNAITIFSSLCIDIIMLSVCIQWVIKGRSWRLLICLFIFYSFRAVVQGLFQLKFPEGFIWDYPGLPSLAVSYLKTNDFFFSGHVGLPILAACELFKNKKNSLGYFALFGCIVEFIVMTIMRGHYIIDLIFGIITAHYVFIIVDKYIHLLDNSILSFKEPTHLGRKSFREREEQSSKKTLCKTCKTCKTCHSCQMSTGNTDEDDTKFY